MAIMSKCILNFTKKYLRLRLSQPVSYLLFSVCRRDEPLHLGQCATQKRLRLLLRHPLRPRYRGPTRERLATVSPPEAVEPDGLSKKQQAGEFGRFCDLFVVLANECPWQLLRFLVGGYKLIE